MSATSDFYYNNGLPYRIENASSLLGSLATRGNKVAVAASPEDEDTVYVGYYMYERDAEALAGYFRRARKVKSSFVTIFPAIKE